MSQSNVESSKELNTSNADIVTNRTNAVRTGRSKTPNKISKSVSAKSSESSRSKSSEPKKSASKRKSISK